MITRGFSLSTMAQNQKERGVRKPYETVQCLLWGWVEVGALSDLCDQRPDWRFAPATHTPFGLFAPGTVVGLA